MILECKTLQLFGKMLFEKATIEPPFKQPYIMENQACFIYIISGEYNSISGFGSLEASPEESVLMKCGSYIPAITSRKDEKYQAIAVHFYPDILLKIYNDKLPSFLKKETSSDIGITKLNSDPLIKRYIDGLLFYFENPQLVSEEMLILKLKEIILLIHQTKNAPAIKTIMANLFNPASFSFREVIEAHFYSKATLDDLAQLNNMSLSTFKREFRKVYNASPASYLRRIKLEKSLDLLISTHLSTTEIAYECGFTNISNFSRTFRKVFGISPTQYKQKNTRNV